MENTLSKFKRYINGWDLRVESLDDKESKEKIKLILSTTSNFLLNQLGEWEEKIVNDDKLNETEIVEKLLKLRDNPKYKEFKIKSEQLLWVRSKIDDLFEIKNRRTKENFDLRAEVVKERMK